MASFTGITAAHADEILGQSVVSGAINGSGHLILTRANGSTLDAGDFTGIVTGILNTQVNNAVANAVPNAVAGSVFHRGNVSSGPALITGVGTANTTALNSTNAVNALITATLTGNVTIDASNMPSSPKANTQFAMRLTQDATGGRTLTLTGGIKKSYGTLDLSTGAGDTDVIMFFYDGTSWYAGAMGFDFS